MARMKIADVNALVIALTARVDRISPWLNEKVVTKLNELTSKTTGLSNELHQVKKENARLNTEIERLVVFKKAVARTMRLQDEASALNGEELEQFLTERGLPLDEVTSGLIVIEDRDDRNWRLWVKYDVYKANTDQANELLKHIRARAAWTTRNLTLWDEFGNGFVLISKKLKGEPQPEPQSKQQETTTTEPESEDTDLDNVDF